MARGAPDFGTTAPFALTAPALDSGELAVRLGSPVVFDRVGHVIFSTLADEPISSEFVVALGAGRADVMAGRGMFGGYGLRLRAGAAAGLETGLLARLPLVVEGGVGGEFVWWSDGDCEGVMLQVLIEHSAGRTHTSLRVNYVDGSTEHFSSGGAWTDTPTQPEGLETTARWHVMKVVHNAADGTFARATFDGQELGMSGVAGRTVGGSGSLMQVTAASTRIDGSAAERDVWVGALIATVNEPT